MVVNCDIKSKFIALCGNKSPRCVSWSLWDLIAVGSNSSVAICDSISQKNDRKKVLITLNKHTDRVNCVQWLHLDESKCYLFSGSSDKSILCWICYKTDFNNYKFEVLCNLTKHSAPVTAVTAIVTAQSNGDRKIVLASCSADQSLFIWKQVDHQDNIEFEIHQSIIFAKSICLTVNLSILPGSEEILLVYGCNDALVHLHYLDKDLRNPALELLKLRGHEDWVRDVRLVTLNNTVLLASCSQDSYIRIWKITELINNTTIEAEDEFNDVLKVSDLQFSMHSNNGNSYTYSVELYTVLSGHDGWIYSLDWLKLNEKVQLLSCSMDKSVIIWEKDEESELWLEKLRCGDVGGNTLGFYGAVFNPTGTEIIAHSFNGALHTWKQKSNAENEIWIACPTVSGHFGAANDICWEPKKGRFLLSTSSDQTTRLYCRSKCEQTWHEIGRPQVHGYDIQCITMINSLIFVSGADEKVIRVFNASRNFLSNLKKICGIDVDETTASVAEGATVPALGLSNKAVTSTDLQSIETNVDPSNRGQMYIENQFRNVALDEPPTEEHLLQNTLWPEIHKLYAHVYEIFCIASSPDGNWIASSAKSSKPEHSNILIWDTSSWKNIATLSCHTLTVTQMEFSMNSKYLLSVSRDRTWAVHHITTTNGKSQFNLITKSNKNTCHSRIIWSCSWSHDDVLFGTASRDKKVMFWKINQPSGKEEMGEGSINEMVTRIGVVPFKESVTAIALGKTLIIHNSYLFVVGKESGGIELHSLQISSFQVELLQRLSVNQQHCSTVKRIKWRPNENNSNHVTFASCSTDCQVKIFSVEFTDV